MEAVPAAPAAAGSMQQSHLLRCLSQLNDDVLAAYLLPKLVQQRSARAVALSCSHMRRLCQHNTQHLDLTKQLQDAYNPCHSPELARQLVAAFPNCTSLDFAWASSSMANVYRSISQLLAGLPHLTTIRIRLDEGCRDCDLDPVLAQLQMHAAGLRSLSLQLSTGWAENPVVWVSLGKLASLTKLHMAFGDMVETPCSECNLQQLTGLSNLQSLRIMAPEAHDFHHADEGQQLQFPRRLTRLTELHLPLGLLQDVSSFSECVNLRRLQLRSGGEVDPLTASDWDAQGFMVLPDLMSLTHLHIDVHLHDGHVFYGVLRQLTGLREVGAYNWPACSLPVLQTLSHITAVYGGWNVPDRVDVSGSVCPHAREVRETWFKVPFQAFPNLTNVTLFWVDVEHLLSLSHHCTGLQRLALSPGRSSAMLPKNSPDAACISAMQNLANLQHLTHLELAPRKDADLMAFVGAAAAASTLQLRYLSIRGPHSVFGLMQVPSVRGVQELTVHLTSSKVEFVFKGVSTWLVGLAVVPKVSLLLCSQEQLDVVDDARRWAVRIGLPLPAVFNVSVVPHHDDEYDSDDYEWEWWSHRQ